MDNNQWIKHQIDRLLESTSVEGPHGCQICKLGGFRKKYSTVSVKFPWKAKSETVSSHRFMYMLTHNNFEMKEKEHVSHLCHNNRCVNPEHLSLEPALVNSRRETCRYIVPKRCMKHEPFKDCLL